jgi:predicted phage terminase large subunit-like protein
LYGGECGGGKSEALVAAPLRWIHHPDFRAILFRRTFPELEKSLIDRSSKLYPYFKASYNSSKHYWIFPSGARIYFGHLEHDKDVFSHQSAEYQYLGWDELTQFTETQYRYLISRLRGPAEIPIRIRAGTNPEPNWVMHRWAPWVDRSPDYRGIRVNSADVLWYLPDDQGGESIVPAGTPGAMSRTFIRAGRINTPQVTADYIHRLSTLDPVQRARLRDGDWGLAKGQGIYYQALWCPIVGRADLSHALARVRYWDRAATVPSKTNPDPDYTVGVLMARYPGDLYVIEDVVRLRSTPSAVDALLAETALADGTSTHIVVEQDPGQAGIAQVQATIRALAGFAVSSRRPTGDKVRRFSPFSSQAEAGNVRLMRGAWNQFYNQELERFPDGSHDDQCDATSGAFNFLTEVRTSARLNFMPQEGYSVW